MYALLIPINEQIFPFSPADTLCCHQSMKMYTITLFRFLSKKEHGNFKNISRYALFVYISGKVEL